MANKNNIGVQPSPFFPSTRTHGTTAPQRVTFLIVPRFNMVEMIAMIEPMRVANYLSPTPLYKWETVAFDGTRITASNGMTVDAEVPSARSRRGELVFVFASWGGETYANRDVLGWVRRQARDGARICAVELGCYIVARAGLLTGRRIATHFSYAPAFQEEFPDISVVDQIFTLDAQVLSCAGSFSTVDLMLCLIREQHGEALASEVSDQLISNPARPATTLQRRGLGNGIENLPPMIRQVISLIERNVSEPLDVPTIAEELGLSQRQLERLFKTAVGCTVVQFSVLVRLQHARVLLVASRQSIREIASATGFNTLSHFAHSFRRCFGRKPSDYRQAWPAKDAAPSWPGTLTRYLEMLQLRTAHDLRKGRTRETEAAK
jgi:transcriptional regulator GlxA family with amidase domain